ncbi:thiolase family protein [Mycolicibacterium goodii]|uniref:Acetyl-CoA acetyltransferase n=1 Tax=Mycolicibacterium goodii TaxID=134601 RepID=A0A0K0XAC2_MYCGD|nr:acetyl-CoA acetyltransferase [Mycolicibacterium goodii]
MTEVVFAEAIRTPLGKRNGGLAGVHPVDLLASCLADLIARSGIDPALVDDHIAGCVGQVGEQAWNIGRNAWLAAGLPEQVPSITVDRQCGSSQQAIHFAAQGIAAGAYHAVIASGVENMSRIPIGQSGAAGPGHPFSEELLQRYDLVGQGLSAELIAARWGITREACDAFAARSHTLAGSARDNGRFDDEMSPVSTTDGIIDRDEGIREPNMEKLASLRPAFWSEESAAKFPEANWVVTAAGASQITDGAAAVLLTSRDFAQKHGLRIRARYVAGTAVGDDPQLMLTAPIPATRKVLEQTGLALTDIDVVEINEAFSPVVLAWKDELKAPDEWFEHTVNPNGGAIALGHPVGCSGARLMATLIHELERRRGRYGLQTMCQAGGLANATVVERVA